MADQEENSGHDGTETGAWQNQQAAGALQQDIEDANQKIAELTDTAKRALADLQNYRKRVEQERATFASFANTGLILELLPILDNFGRAFAQVPSEVSKTDWFKGALQIEQQLMGIMRKQGVIEMPSQVGKKLDTRIHEPVTTGPGEPDVILEEFEKGYMMGDKVIRPAKVKVGNGTAK